MIGSTTQQLKKSEESTLYPRLSILPETAPRRQIRLIQDIDSRIEDFCRQQKITIETYLEALHVISQQNALLSETVIVEAKKRLLARKRAGKIRRWQTQGKVGF